MTRRVAEILFIAFIASLSIGWGIFFGWLFITQISGGFLS